MIRYRTGPWLITPLQITLGSIILEPITLEPIALEPIAPLLITSLWVFLCGFFSFMNVSFTRGKSPILDINKCNFDARYRSSQGNPFFYLICANKSNYWQEFDSYISL